MEGGEGEHLVGGIHQGILNAENSDKGFPRRRRRKRRRGFICDYDGWAIVNPAQLLQHKSD